MPRLAPRPIVARPSTPSCVTPDAGEPDYFYSDEAYPEDDANFLSMDADLVVAAGDVEGTMADLVAEFEAEAANLDEAEAAALWQRIVSAFESEELRAYKGRPASAPSKSDAAAVAFSWANAEGGAEAAAVLALENSVDEALLGAYNTEEVEDGEEDEGEEEPVVDAAAPSVLVAASVAALRAAVGIDLGTTNSAIAAVVDGSPTALVIPPDEWDASLPPVTPSVVAFVETGDDDVADHIALRDDTGGGAVVVGAAARRHAVSNRGNTFSSAKRLLGRSTSEDDLARLGLDGSVAGGGEVLLRCKALGGTTITPTDVAAEVLRHLLRTAEAALGGRQISEAVVTVPADPATRTGRHEAIEASTVTAGMLAGLDNVVTLQEPVAAAIAYAAAAGEKKLAVAGAALVVDLGGGTLDVAVVAPPSGKGAEWSVRASACDPRLGGDDFSHAVQSWLVDSFVSEHGACIDDLGRARLFDAAEEAKFELSCATKTEIDVPALGSDGAALRVDLSRRKFDGLCKNLIARIEAPILDAVARSECPVDTVVLIGGGTAMPCVRRAVARVTGIKPRENLVDPLTAVAVGAALHAEALGLGRE